MRLSERAPTDLTNEKLDDKNKFKTEILEEFMEENQPDNSSCINACNIYNIEDCNETEVKQEEMIDSLSKNELCELQESQMNCLSFESAGDEKDFVINIVPVADDELISMNSNIEIKDESHNQVSVRKQPRYSLYY